jgi:plasmid stability protein
MTSITIPNVDDDLKQRLKVRAAEHGRSIEAEARDILRSALKGNEGEPAATANLGDAIRAIVEPIGGIELDIPPRKPIREPPKFE